MALFNTQTDSGQAKSFKRGKHADGKVSMTQIRQHLMNLVEEHSLDLATTEQTPIAGGKALSISKKPETQEDKILKSRQLQEIAY